MYSDLSILLTTTLIFKCREYAYNLAYELIPFEICLIHKLTHFRFT